MNTMENLRDMLENELSEIVAMGELDDHKLGCVDKIVDILKDIGEIEMSEGGYSERGRSYRGSYTGRGGYSGRRYNRGYSRGGYSRDGEMMSRMEDMMSNAQTEEERDMIRRIMNQM